MKKKTTKKKLYLDMLCTHCGGKGLVKTDLTDLPSLYKLLKGIKLYTRKV